MAPILLQCASTTQELDQAGIIVDKRVLPTYNPGHYTPKLLPNHVKPLDTLDYVPSLEYFCIKYLYSNVDLVDLGGLPRFPFHPGAHMAWLRGLIPLFTFDMRDVDLKYVDPRLWGTLIQLYSLPPVFHIYMLPLSDTHLTQLQAIRSTPDFTLITVLDLSSRCEITDETIGELKPLKNLCVLDLSLTGIGAWGVKKLSMCLVRKHDGRNERVGPWGIRIWSLRGCKKVDDSVKDALTRFPLLSVIGALMSVFFSCPRQVTLFNNQTSVTLPLLPFLASQASPPGHLPHTLQSTTQIHLSRGLMAYPKLSLVVGSSNRTIWIHFTFCI
jgi:hypothetical protein